MNWTWLLRVFTVLAWLVALVWFINSWANHESYYQSLIAFLLGSASLIGSFLSKDKGSNIELAKTAVSNGSVALDNVHNSEINISVENREGNDKRSQLNNEMELLIAPLYAKMNKNSAILSFMSTHGTSRMWSFTDNQERMELENLETEIKEIMRQYGHRASKQLFSGIENFLNLKPEYNPDRHREAYNTLIEIKTLVKLRYDQLRIEIK
jgi:hypothetical protein